MMTTTIRHRAHRGVAVAVLGSLIGCAVEDTGEGSSPTSTVSAATPSSDPTAGGAVPNDPTGAVRIRLRIGDDEATATLQDSAPARDVAGHAADDHPNARPVRAGEARPAASPAQHRGARREFDYQVGELAYPSPAWSAWAPSTLGWR
jgi:hypothetical protein